MDAYVFRAALYCPPCAARIRARLDRTADTGDSGDYPYGYANGGGTSDSPQHCDSCGVFLENPLTEDGKAYVRDAIASSPADSVARTVWAPFYGLP